MYTPATIPRIASHRFFEAWHDGMNFEGTEDLRGNGPGRLGRLCEDK
jgi:hypothetical protein